ncbi:MAG TPA: hypothetical protein DDY57_07040 [Franconibacter pulveris]|nr:hypothetical protein [Franconibacter pulveris]
MGYSDTIRNNARRITEGMNERQNLRIREGLGNACGQPLTDTTWQFRWLLAPGDNAIDGSE